LNGLFEILHHVAFTPINPKAATMVATAGRFYLYGARRADSSGKRRRHHPGNPDLRSRL
jgi:hypothetical protein